jgi:hypothetical protein
MPPNERLRPDNGENLQDRRKPAIQLDQEPAVLVREPDATMQPPLQDNQLLSEHRVLSLKPQLRLEWRGEDGQSEAEQPDHSASLGDSVTSSTRIRFSVHTGDPALGAGLNHPHPARKDEIREFYVLDYWAFTRAGPRSGILTILRFGASAKSHPNVKRLTEKPLEFRDIPMDAASFPCSPGRAALLFKQR